MRPFSPPDSTFTDFLVSSPENSSRPKVARTIWSSSALPVYCDIQENRSDLVVELGLRVLRHVARLRIFDPDDAPAVGRNSPARQRISVVLPDAVRSDDGDALAAFDVEAEIVEHFFVRARIAEAQFLHRHRRAVQFLALLESDVGVLPR